MDQKNLGKHIWNVAELLRGDFKQSEYGLIILPFTVLHRFECVLEPTRDAVRQKMDEVAELGIDPDLVLPEVSGQQFYNTSRYRLDNLGVANTLANLEDYINKFSANARAVFEQFEFYNKLLRLDEDKLLYKVARYFAGIDLHIGRKPSQSTIWFSFGSESPSASSCS